MRTIRSLGAMTVIALAALACSDRDPVRAPDAVRRGMEGGGMPLVVEADLPIARLVLTIDDGFGRREVELRREDKAGLLAGAIDVAPDTRARLTFNAYDAEGQGLYTGKGTLLTSSEITAQQEFALAGVPGTDPASVRIGTYRLALSPAVIENVPGRETRIEAMLLDARGERHPFDKESLEWLPDAQQKEIGNIIYDYQGYLINIFWIPEKWYMGTVKFCTHGVPLCGKLTLSDPNPVIQVTAGAWHSCALRKSGRVSCWGDNVTGTLGKDASGTSMIAGIVFKSISAGYYHNCGIDDTDTVQCWGTNGSGQIGLPSSTAWSRNAIAVSLPAAAQQVSAGSTHSCALLVNGETWCWGGNGVGQLGDGSALAMPAVFASSTPVKVSGGLTFSAISAGDDHTCGLAAGVAWCWGGNGDSQSGIAPSANEKCNLRTLTWYPYTTSWDNCLTTPRQVQTSQVFAGIGAGHRATCAHTTAGVGFCWGKPSMQNPPVYGQFWVPWTQSGLSTFKRFTAASSFQCAIDTGDMIQCMGANGYGQTGTNSMLFTTTAMAPVALQDVWSDMDAGSFHGCGVRAQGFVISCWGENSHGQLGRATPSGMSLLPQNVTVTY